MDSVLIKILDGFAAGVRKLNAGAVYLGIVTLIVISVVSLYGIATRLIGMPVSWSLEFLQLIQIVLAFLPVAYVLNRNAHVRMDLGVDLVHGNRRHMLQCLASILGMCMSGLMVYATSQGAISSTSMREASVLTSLPVYPFKICVVIGFALLTLQFAGHAWESLRSILFSSADAEAVSPHVYL
ncbi:MAG: TRAP transporter small permease [Proteobacteria bacterium]|nr:TRAP transporter small permease [Pseudomonadota bacterium]